MKKKLLSLFTALCLALGYISMFPQPSYAASTVWNGSADTSWYTASPDASSYTITTAEQLAGLSEIAESAQNDLFKGKTIRLGNDIVLNDVANLKNWTTSKPARIWTPVFIFAGTFDGAGHTVSGAYVNTSENAGLFGSLTDSAEIKNLTVSSSLIIGSGEYTAGIAGFAESSTKLSGCSNAATIKGTQYASGIAYDGVFKDCRNSGAVNGSDSTGGIAAEGIRLTSCMNFGAVGGSDNVGGICGKATVIESCTNSGAVTGLLNIGGIAGTVSGIGHITGSSNKGSVSSAASAGNVNIGGIVGNAGCDLSGCTNSGAVSASSGTAMIGGIAGYLDADCTIFDSKNTDTISGNSLYCGGISGYADGLISRCDNSGAVSSNTNSAFVGGIAGYGSDVINSGNQNPITAKGLTATVGGIGGQLLSVRNCLNSGTIKADAAKYAGGIAGIGVFARNCYNTGSIGTGGSYIGSIFGAANGDASFCYYLSSTARGKAFGTQGSAFSANYNSGFSTDGKDNLVSYNGASSKITLCLALEYFVRDNQEISPNAEKLYLNWTTDGGYPYLIEGYSYNDPQLANASVNGVSISFPERNQDMTVAPGSTITITAEFSGTAAHTGLLNLAMTSAYAEFDTDTPQYPVNDGTDASGSADFTFTMPMRDLTDITLSAVFSESSFSITPVDCTLSPRIFEAGSGTEITATADALDNKWFREWKITGARSYRINDNGSLTFVVGHSDITVTALFDTVRTVTISGGTIDGDTSFYAVKGDSVTAVADVIDGRTFKSWAANGVSLGSGATSPTVTFTMPDNDVTLTAVYDNMHLVTVVNGTTDKSAAQAGELVTVTAAELAYKRFKSWSATGVTLTDKTSASISFIMPDKDVKLTAVYDNLYEVTAIDCTADKTIVTAGETITVTAPEIEGMVFRSWKGTGISISGNSMTATFKMPSRDVTVQALYDKLYTISTDNCTASKTVAKAGETITITTTAVSGKTFRGWKSTGVTLSSYSPSVTKFTFKMPENNVVIAAIYDTLYYITAVNAKSDKITANPGDIITITADIPENTQFRKWSASGITPPATNVNSFTFTMPESDVTVTAEYDKLYKISVTNGTASKTTAKAGDIISITATKFQSAVFEQWTSIGVTLSKPKLTTTTFAMPANDVVLTANYYNIYSVTVINGTASSTAAKAGTQVTVTADKITRKVFRSWGAQGVTITDKTQKTITFIMPQNNVVLTALFNSTDTPSGGSGSGSGSSGGSGSGSSGSGGNTGIDSGDATPPDYSAEKDAAHYLIAGKAITLGDLIAYTTVAISGQRIDLSISKSTVIPKEILEVIKGRDVVLTVTTGSGVALDINGRDIRTAADISIPTKLSALTDSALGKKCSSSDIVLDVSLNGLSSYGLTADADITAGKGFAGKFANIMKRSGSTYTLSEVVQIDNNGHFSISGITGNAEFYAVIDNGSYLHGDSDNNGKIDARDVSVLLQHLTGTNKLTAQRLKFCDVTGDGKVNSKDAIYILKHLITGGKFKSYSVKV